MTFMAAIEKKHTVEIDSKTVGYFCEDRSDHVVLRRFVEVFGMLGR